MVSCRPPFVQRAEVDKFGEDSFVMVGDFDDAAGDDVLSVRIDACFVFHSVAPFLSGCSQRGSRPAGRIACACPKVLFVRGGSGTETVNERTSGRDTKGAAGRVPLLLRATAQ